MTTIRSSVRPESSKQPWGTILKPHFGLGYQKMTEYEIDQTVNRLYTIPSPKEMSYERSYKELPKEKIDAMVSEKKLSRNCDTEANVEDYTSQQFSSVQCSSGWYLKTWQQLRLTQPMDDAFVAVLCRCPLSLCKHSSQNF